MTFVWRCALFFFIAKASRPRQMRLYFSGNTPKDSYAARADFLKKALGTHTGISLQSIMQRRAESRLYCILLCQHLLYANKHHYQTISQGRKWDQRRKGKIENWKFCSSATFMTFTDNFLRIRINFSGFCQFALFMIFLSVIWIIKDPDSRGFFFC